MASVITDSCVKDLFCLDACPTDCIHPKQDQPRFEEATQLYIDSTACIDCGACMSVCITSAIFPEDELPEEKKQFAEKNAAYYICSTT